MGSGHFADPHFRLRVMRIARHPEDSRQHSHSFEELVIVLAGSGRHRVGKETYDISAGDVFVLLGESSHCYPETRGLSLINILYDSAGLRIPRADLGALPGYHALFEVEPRLRQSGRFQNRLKLEMDELGTLAGMIGELEAELDGRAPGSRFLATAHLMRVIGFLSRAYGKMDAGNRLPVAQISKLLGYMEQHHAEELTVRGLALVAHMSETSLFRLFRRIVGRSPVDYLIRLRIGKAAGLLRREQLRIKEVSDAVGFSDSNYFTRQFRKVTGMSPRDYRRSGR
jgi:AraC-like DNA-binding protein